MKKITAILIALFMLTGGIEKGAYIIGSGYEISEFESLVGSHQSYIYHLAEGSEVNEKWIIECIANNVMPLIAIAPKNADDVFNIENFSKTIDSLKKYNIPLIISVYPCPKGIYEPSEYRAFFKRASNICRIKLSDVKILWSTDDAYSSFEYFVRDSVDIVGFEAYEEIKDGNINYKYLDYQYFYQKMNTVKPVIISAFAVSHQDYGDKKYYIKQASNELKSFYENVFENFPLTERIYYMSISTADCDFSLLSDNEILQSYKETQ